MIVSTKEIAPTNARAKNFYLISVWVCKSRTRPVEYEHFYFATHAIDRKAAKRNATRKFRAKGYDVDFCCLEDTNCQGLDALAIKAEIQQRIALYESRIAETEKMTDAEISNLGLVDCARRLLDYKALEEAKKKLAAFDAL